MVESPRVRYCAREGQLKWVPPRDGGEPTEHALGPNLKASHRPSYAELRISRGSMMHRNLEAECPAAPMTGFGKLVGATRFEPATSSTPWKRATKLRHAPTRRERIPPKEPEGLATRSPILKRKDPSASSTLPVVP